MRLLCWWSRSLRQCGFYMAEAGNSIDESEPPAAYEGLCFLDDAFKAMLACLELYSICRRDRQAETSMQHSKHAGAALESSSSWNPLTHSLSSEAAFQKGLPPVGPLRKSCPRPGQI